jgi:group I intron endonuclease
VGGIAQMVERLLCTQEVLGSNPNVSNMNFFLFFNIKRSFVTHITLGSKHTVDKSNHKLVMIEKTVTYDGLPDFVPTKYYKIFNTLTKQEFSKIRKEFQKVSLIYLWRNKETNHCYIGSSINFGNRLYAYTCISNISRSNSIIYKAIEKYSHKAFELYILEKHIDINQEDLLLREDYWIFLVNPSYNINRKKYIVLNNILYKMPVLDVNAYAQIAKILAEKQSLLKNKTKSNYKPVFLFEKNTERLIHYFYRTDQFCDFIGKNRDYVRSRLDKNTTITVNGLECYMQSLDTFVKPTKPFYGTANNRKNNQKVYCFSVEHTGDQCEKTAKLVKQFINVKSFLKYTGKSKGSYYISCLDKPKPFEFIQNNIKHRWYIQRTPDFITRKKS